MLIQLLPVTITRFLIGNLKSGVRFVAADVKVTDINKKKNIVGLIHIFHSVEKNFPGSPNPGVQYYIELQ